MRFHHTISSLINFDGQTLFPVFFFFLLLPFQKSSKSLDACDRSENNNKPLKSIQSLDNTKVTPTPTNTMGTKETDVVGQNAAIDNGKKVISLTTNAGSATATTPSPTALTAAPTGGSSSDANSRASSKGHSPAEELTNGLDGSGKSAGSSPGALNSAGDGIVKGRSPTGSLPGKNLNNNGNVNGESGVAEGGDKSPLSDGLRSDGNRMRKPIDGDNNVSLENDSGK